MPTLHKHSHFPKPGIFLAGILTAGMILTTPVGAVIRGNTSSPAPVILIGDSRTEGMYETVGDSGVLWEYESGMGYTWMTETGVPEIEPMIGNGTSVIIMLGVNDIGDTWMASSYANYLNEKAAQWKQAGARTYYVAVTKCSDDYSDRWGTDNAHIAAWNSEIRQMLSQDVIYMDVEGALGSVGTVDGLHYTSDTYQRLFSIISGYVDVNAVNTTPEYTYEPGDIGGFGDSPIISEWYSNGAVAGVTGIGEVTDDGHVAGVTGFGSAEEIPELSDGEIIKIDDINQEEHAQETEEPEDTNDTVTEIFLPEENTGAVPGVVGTNDPEAATLPDMSQTALEELVNEEQEQTEPSYLDEQQDDDEKPNEAVPGVVGTNDPIETVINNEETESSAEAIVEEETAVLDDSTTDETQPEKTEEASQSSAESSAEPVLEEQPSEPSGDESDLNKEEEETVRPNDEKKEEDSENDGRLVNLDEQINGDITPDKDAGNGSMLAPLMGTAIDSEAIDATPEKTGWQEQENVTSYFADDGTKVTGIEEIEGNLYYFDGSGRLVKNGIYMDNTGITCADEDGRLVVGWRTEGGKTYLFKENGYAAIGITEFEGKKYCFDYDGTMQKGLFIKDGAIYLTDEDGSLASGWIEYQGNTYYCTENGALTGAQVIDGKSYLFDANGALLKGTVNYDGSMYELGSEGVIEPGWHESGNNLTYTDASGRKVTGWQKIDGKIYYFGKNGIAAKGVFEKDNKWYRFDEENGYLIDGFDGGIGNGKEALPSTYKKDGDFWRVSTVEDFMRTIDEESPLRAFYPEAAKGDAFDENQVKLRKFYSDGTSEEVTMFTVGDLSTNPVTLEGDTMLTIDSIYGKTTLIINLKKAERVEAKDEESTHEGLHASYQGVVYEGDRIRKSLVSVTNINEKGKVEDITGFTVSRNNMEIMEETKIPIETSKGTVELTINPIRIVYVEADVTGIKRPGETIDPEYVVFGYSNGTYRRVSITECEFGIEPYEKTLVAGKNEFPLIWKNKEYTMTVTAVEDKSLEEATSTQNFNFNTSTPVYDTGATQDSGSIFAASDLSGLNLVSLGTWKLTGYADTPEDQGPYVGQTASGAPLVAGRTVAISSATMARRGLNFGDRIVVNGHLYTIEDHGGSAMHDQDWVDIYCGTAAEGGSSLEYSDACNGYAEVYLVQ